MRRRAAHPLELVHESGSLEPGLMADLCLWDWAATAVDRGRQDMARELHEKVLAWLLLSDERHLAGT